VAKVLCVSDNPIHVAMFADMLKRRDRHEVVTMVPPLDLGAIAALNPDVILVHLVRRIEALRSPIANFDTEVEGARSLRVLLEGMPPPRPCLIVTGIAVEARHLPPGLEVATFVEIPGGLDRLLEAVDRLDASALK
jgi:hypothetical protein